ncbi:Hypothetical predicted protein [Mytilus galloprovincialis]|uniref:Uncharacterized protein n=1 Tax=Mytilus galloprovincialis TaxID=29158 RepID=A0A8B6DH62_MYTGA|nr:Hypothetical predicted protein [Mytilus galloprovincialis]
MRLVLNLHPAQIKLYRVPMRYLAHKMTQYLTLQLRIVRLVNDMILLKSEYARDSEMLNRSIEDLKKENKQLKDRDFKYSDRFKNLQNQINVIKTKTESITTCTETFQIDVNTIKVQLQQNCEQNSKTNSELKYLVSQFLESVKTVTEMKSDIDKIHENITKHNVNMKTVDKTVKAESERLNRMSDTRTIGVGSLKSKTDLINSKLKDLDAK